MNRSQVCDSQVMILVPWCRDGVRDAALATYRGKGEEVKGRVVFGNPVTVEAGGEADERE